LGLERYDVGAANPTLNRNHLHELDVLVPALFQQERIASILSAYDDLIENNTRRIAILEEMARRIFDFDMEHTPDNSAAYPETPVMSVIDVTLGGDWGADAASGEETNNVRIIRGTDFRRIEAGDFSTVPSRFVSGTSLKRRRLRAFDLVVENSINAKTRAAGTPLLINSGVLRALEGPAIATSFCRQFRCKTFAEGVFLFHYLRWLRRRRLIEEFQVIAANGIANFQTEQFLSRASIPLAGEEIRQIGGKLMQFDPTVLRAQISNLRAQRDLLLPKLVSGDIDVSAIGASLKEAAE
jgi:type I restriction enzyme S subunit